MSILLVHPPWQHFPSGGNVFNRYIIEQAEREGYPLVSLPVSTPQATSAIYTHIGRISPSLVIWDSLFLKALYRKHPKLGRQPLALLFHYLPSLNPQMRMSEKYAIRQLEDCAAETADFFIATGYRVQQTLIKRYPQKDIFLCEPGIDCSLFTPQEKFPRGNSKKRIHLLTVANLIPAKGYIDLLELLSHTTDLPWVWHWVGDDRADKKQVALIWSTVERLKLTGRIRFHGVLSSVQLAKLMHRTDLFLSASHYEAYGMAVAEAVASGLPVVATQTGKSDRLVDHGRTGYLVPVGHWESMRHFVIKLIQKPSLREEFSRNTLTKTPRKWDECFIEFKNCLQKMTAAIESEN